MCSKSRTPPPAPQYERRDSLEPSAMDIKQTPKSWNMDVGCFILAYLLFLVLGLEESQCSNSLASTVGFPGTYFC